MLGTIAPICIAAAIAIAMGLLVTAFIGGVPALIVTSILVIAGFWIGWHRGEVIHDCILKMLNK